MPQVPITKHLILQCSKGIKLTGCKPRCSADGTMNEDFLSFPYLVGMSFSSQNIDDIMYYRTELGIGDSMITEPATVEFICSCKICPWQRNWMEPLLELRNCNIYVKSSTPEGNTKKGYSFKEKFLNFARFADHALQSKL